MIEPDLPPPIFPPLSSTVQVTVGAHSHTGRIHDVNEDHYLIIRLGRSQETLRTSLPERLIDPRYDEYGYAMVVADGVGDRGGELASRIALTTLMQLVLYFGKWNLRVDHKVAEEILERADGFYRQIDSTLVHEGLVHPGRRLQTTLTAVFGAGRDLFFAHVGHSRAYLLRQGSLMRLTRDHAINRRPSPHVTTAPLVDVNSTARDLKHILTETIGKRGSMGPEIDLERIQLSDDDRVLVCTNGLTDAVDEDIIASILAADRTPDEQCQTLVTLAMELGGDDDVTALVSRYRIPD